MSLLCQAYLPFNNCSFCLLAQIGYFSLKCMTLLRQIVAPKERIAIYVAKLPIQGDDEF